MTVSAGSSVNVPYFQADEKIHRRKLAEWAKQANIGHIPVVGNVTLAAGATSTSVADARVAPGSWIGLVPITANALSAAPTVWVSTFGIEYFVITHANSASADKTFRYAVLGV